MQRIILAAALCLASGAGQAAMPCDKPEYLQLKSADKAELQQEFCSATRKHSLNLKLRDGNEEGISRLRAIGADVSKHVKQSQDDLDAAQSCSKAAAQFAGALERRFKSKPPAVKACLSPGGI
ncbi:hypothetical protein [Massilia sp. CFBP9026]|uniref:hypothetical protein n=1 Tax=Massilia sp. CFBP9026 TaxID=3096536 RepID=UPI002A69A466|nr:hypothetical protein [Massilia sp. CFBP9026]MDY0961734.1 hypothetical protein [Massilia sp. CFBP9026]